MKYRFLGKVKNGKLTLIDREKFINFLYKLSGIVELSIGNISKERTLSQNAYYWSVVVNGIADEMGTLPDFAHEMLKQLFLKSGYDFKGKRYDYVRSTTSLDTREFSDYVEKCKMWAASELNLTLPEAGEIELN